MHPKYDAFMGPPPSMAKPNVADQSSAGLQVDLPGQPTPISLVTINLDHPELLMRMTKLLVVLAQKVLAIIVAVGRTNYGVNMITGRSVGFEGNATLVIELD